MSNTHGGKGLPTRQGSVMAGNEIPRRAVTIRSHLLINDGLERREHAVMADHSGWRDALLEDESVAETLRLPGGRRRRPAFMELHFE